MISLFALPTVSIVPAIIAEAGKVAPKTTKKITKST